MHWNMFEQPLCPSRYSKVLAAKDWGQASSLEYHDKPNHSQLGHICTRQDALPDLLGEQTVIPLFIGSGPKLSALNLHSYSMLL